MSDAAPASRTRALPQPRSEPHVVPAHLGKSGQRGPGTETATRTVATHGPVVPRHRSPTHSTDPSVAIGGAPPPRRRLAVAAATVTLAALGTAVFTLTHRADDHSSGSEGLTPATHVARPIDFPRAAPDPGVYVTTTLRPDGSLVTNQWVIAIDPTDSVDLAVTTPTGQLDFEPEVSDVSVVADGEQVETTTDSDQSGGSTTIAFAQPARYVHLFYVVSGVALLSDSAVSPPGRALVLLNGARVRSAADGAQVIHVRGGNVLSLSCWRKDVAPVPCGSETKAGWAVHLPGSDYSVGVVAQVDLPGR
jgi:hypothetical protein